MKKGCDLDELARLAAEATPGPWFFNSYSGVFSEPRVREYDEAESKLAEDAPDSEWGKLPEPLVCSVPTVAGDTGTEQGRKDAAYIAAACNAVPLLLAEIRILRARSTG
ncbi:MAG: hypothetical protein DWQ35_00430 [Planctomycetota bacterium]|nr:MAG: hypothetical protein DWQ35_00430 [Planctomycetota bacterium]